MLNSVVNIILVFEKAGVDLSLPIVSTCGSGITAAIIALSAHYLSKDIALYDVSNSCFVYCGHYG